MVVEVIHYPEVRCDGIVAFFACPGQIDLSYNLHGSSISQLDVLLRSEFDYPSIETEVKEQDVAKFRAYIAVYDEWTSFQNCYIGFDDADKARVELWLQQWPQSDA